jgi:alpha-tubulin suppressor-like RCC1 family protein
MCGGGEVVDVSGSSYSCALTKAGRLFCWGVNQYGQLGVPLSTNQACGPDQWPCRFEAVEVQGLTDAVDVSVGLDYACAVRRTGAVVCWGRNEFGQLGHDPATDPRCGEPCNGTPTEVRGVTGAIGVAAGRWQACAWTAGGAAYCWGRNNEGVLGRGTLSEVEPAAAPVVGLGQGGITEIAMMLGGVNHACAVKADKTVWCWGRNSHGQLGHAQGPPLDVPCLGDFCGATPRQVPGMTGVIDAFVSDGASCVVRDDESVWCWGFDGSGLRGAFTGSPAPARVAGIPPALSGSAHRGHVCVRSSLSDVWCWGQNYFGQLGDGTFSGGFNGHVCQCKPPAQVPDLKVKQLAVANDFTLGVKFDGTVWAWGFSSAGALGHQPGTLGDVACRDQKPCNTAARQVRGLPP